MRPRPTAASSLALATAVSLGASRAQAQTVHVLVAPDPGVRVDRAETGYVTGSRSSEVWHPHDGCEVAPCVFSTRPRRTTIRVWGADGMSATPVALDRDTRVVVHAAPELRVAHALFVSALATFIATAAYTITWALATRHAHGCTPPTDFSAGCGVESGLEWGTFGGVGLALALSLPATGLVGHAESRRITAVPWVGPSSAVETSSP
jgi:hypothetical protein